jgi:hypothetical protein
MKVLNLLVLLFVLAVGASAQVVSDRSEALDVSVLQKKWSMQVRNPALDEDPLRINQEQMELQRAQRVILRENEIRANQGLPPLNLPRDTPKRGSVMVQPPSVEYVYEAKFMNTGQRKIRKLVWEYVFSEPASQREVGRRQFQSKVNIRPGKTASVTMRSVAPPASTVNVTQTGKKLREQYSEQIIIQSIEYDDGSAWQRPSN